MKLFEKIKECNSENDLSKVLATVTWVCGDCSPDNLDDCVTCLKTQLRNLYKPCRKTP